MPILRHEAGREIPMGINRASVNRLAFTHHEPIGVVVVAERLATDQRVGFFSFIGSAKVGWMLRSKLTPGVRCGLEHGGAAPVILAPDADS